jgi:hypothetical protein
MVVFLDDLTLVVMLAFSCVQFLAALNQAKMLRPDLFEFTSLEQRFHKQFEPFLQITSPPALSYDDFQTGSDFQNVTQADLLSSTSECFKSCKTMLDSIASRVGAMDRKFSPLGEDEIRALTRVCVGNSVFLMKLLQKVRSDGTAQGKVTFDFAANAQFCIIKID